MRLAFQFNFAVFIKNKICSLVAQTKVLRPLLSASRALENIEIGGGTGNIHFDYAIVGHCDKGVFSKDRIQLFRVHRQHSPAGRRSPASCDMQQVTASRLLSGWINLLIKMRQAA